MAKRNYNCSVVGMFPTLRVFEVDKDFDWANPKLPMPSCIIRQVRRRNVAYVVFINGQFRMGENIAKRVSRNTRQTDGKSTDQG